MNKKDILQLAYDHRLDALTYTQFPRIKKGTVYWNFTTVSDYMCWINDDGIAFNSISHSHKENCKCDLCYEPKMFRGFKIVK